MQRTSTKPPTRRPRPSLGLGKRHFQFRCRPCYTGIAGVWGPSEHLWLAGMKPLSCHLPIGVQLKLTAIYLLLGLLKELPPPDSQAKLD